MGESFMMLELNISETRRQCIDVAVSASRHWNARVTIENVTSSLL